MAAFDARMVEIRVLMLRILLIVSSAARLWLSLVHPRLPMSFSSDSAYALGTIAFVAPPSHMFHPAALIPSGNVDVPVLLVE